MTEHAVRLQTNLPQEADLTNVHLPIWFPPSERPRRAHGQRHRRASVLGWRPVLRDGYIGLLRIPGNPPVDEEEEEEAAGDHSGLGSRASMRGGASVLLGSCSWLQLRESRQA